MKNKRSFKSANKNFLVLLKNDKGITLVALVVTLVVLLILAAVSISLVMRQDGIIANAREARKKSKNVAEEESHLLNNDIPNHIAAQVNEVNSGSSEDSGKDDENKDEDKKEEIVLPSTKRTKPYLPGNKFTLVEGTNLDNGLVIQDENGNQYVWVEVPMMATLYSTAGMNITTFDDEAYKNIENDLIYYTMSYRSGANATETKDKDEYYPDTDYASDWFAGENEYNELKRKMLKSVYQNGGFWIARYEAGIENNRISGTTPTILPQSKQNMYPYTYITRTQAKKLAEMVNYKINGTTYTGSLMFGLQWDLVLAFMHSKGSIANSVLNSNSESIGNYYNSTFEINRGAYTTYLNFNFDTKWSLYNTAKSGYVNSDKNKLAQTSSGNGVLLTTGAAERNKVMNIYDIAGNVFEWTLENCNSVNGKHCSDRGGGCIDLSTTYYASYRGYTNTSDKSPNIGFRISIF